MVYFLKIYSDLQFYEKKYIVSIPDFPNTVYNSGNFEKNI